MKFFVTFTNLYLASIPLILLPFVRQFFTSTFFDLFSLVFVAQSVIMILEFGLTNILVRLTGDVRKNIVGDSRLYSFCLTVSMYVILIGCASSSMIAVNSIFGIVALTELKHDFLACLIFIGCSRFLAAIPRIVLYGYELFLETSLSVISLSTLRFLIPLSLLYFDCFDQISFFYTYFFISFLEGIILWIYLVYKMDLIKRVVKSISPFKHSAFILKKYWQTAIFTFIPSFMWLLSSQGDKAFYMLEEGLEGSGMIVAISGLASGILLLINSVNSAFIPRLVAVNSGSHSQKQNFYQMVLIGVSILVLATVIVLSYSHDLLILWFQDSTIEPAFGYLLRLYFTYFSILAASSYFYVYFFINDILKYHLITNIFYSLIVAVIWLKANDLNEYMQLMCANVSVCFLLSGFLLLRHKFGHRCADER